MKKISLICLTCILLLTACGKVELIDGNAKIVSFKDEEGISAESLYETLKEAYGIDYLVDMIDTYLLDKEYDETDTENEYIKQVVNSIKDAAEKYDIEFEDYIKQYYGVVNESGLKEFIRLNYRRNLYLSDYAKTLVTDKQINEYYETTAVGDMKVKHILIMPDSDSDATTEEQEEAENEALQTAKDIIKKLDAGEDFSELAKEYSDDTASASNGGELDYFNRGEMDENFEEASVNLEVGKYTTSPVKSSYGYHIIYKVDQKEKDSLENIKDEIIDTISEELISSTANIYYNSLQNLREKYDMEIIDSELKSDYSNYLLSLTSE